MKPILAFLFHLLIASLAVPMLALLSSAGIVYPLIRHIGFSSTNPQQFCSEHLFLFLLLTGIWLAYLVCDTFTSRSALWVWVPAVLLLGIRIAMWRLSGSVLYHSSVVEHFFAANCQFQSWRETTFAQRCGDKLLLMQLVIAPFGYSAGAAIYHMLRAKRRGRTIVAS
jgi:hypothetical protein